MSLKRDSALEEEPMIVGAKTRARLAVGILLASELLATLRGKNKKEKQINVKENNN